MFQASEGADLLLSTHGPKLDELLKSYHYPVATLENKKDALRGVNAICDELVASKTAIARMLSKHSMYKVGSLLHNLKTAHWADGELKHIGEQIEAKSRDRSGGSAPASN